MFLKKAVNTECVSSQLRCHVYQLMKIRKSVSCHDGIVTQLPLVYIRFVDFFHMQTYSARKRFRRHASFGASHINDVAARLYYQSAMLVFLVVLSKLQKFSELFICFSKMLWKGDGIMT